MDLDPNHMLRRFRELHADEETFADNLHLMVNLAAGLDELATGGQLPTEWRASYVEKLFDKALDARRWITSPNKALALRMQHFLDADCGCIAELTNTTIESVRNEVERRLFPWG